MRQNSFTNKMIKKSNIELETIFKNKNDYTEEAIQAVTWELENRNLIEKTTISYLETPTNKKNEETSIIKENLENNESPFEVFEKPFLYSKKTIQGFTIFFSTIFGVALLMYNLKQMNKPKARINVLIFGVIYTIFTFVALEVLPKSFFITLLFNFVGFAFLSEFFWNKNLGKNIKYKKKQIWKPLIISILITLALLFFIFFIANFS